MDLEALLEAQPMGVGVYLFKSLAIISNVNLCNFKQDHLIWKLEKEWVVSVKSLYKCLLASFCDMKLGMPFIWLGIAPPKVENLI